MYVHVHVCTTVQHTIAKHRVSTSVIMHKYMYMYIVVIKPKLPAGGSYMYIPAYLQWATGLIVNLVNHIMPFLQLQSPDRHV